MDFKKLNKLADKGPEYVADIIITSQHNEEIDGYRQANDFINDLREASAELLSKKHTTEDDYNTFVSNGKLIYDATIIAYMPEKATESLGYPKEWTNYITKIKAHHIYIAGEMNVGGQYCQKIY